MFKFAFFLTDEVLNESAEVLSLSARAHNALRRSGICTLGEILDRWEDLDTVRSLGATSVKEIRAKMFAYNLNRIWNDDKLLERFADSIKQTRRLNVG